MRSIGQNRTLANTGVRSDLSYAKGIHNIKVGVTYEQTFLTENFGLGIVSPTLNSPCLTLATAANPNAPVAGFTDPSQIAARMAMQPNVAANPHADFAFHSATGLSTI